ncbi:hypothetical protein ACQP2Y_03695 [Actinoplanes sp. CA-051413]|uniref:hypothetical protein n=1 Tax=Actinoplanes sp. CA-051413 TaxID=3239899 RepID=UPI003D968287
MTFVHVDVLHRTHTCPADPEPHPYDTWRRIVVIVDGGPCRKPVTIRSGNTTATIACGRHEPAARQCPACRVTVIEHSVTATFTGHHGPQHPTTTGIAA